MLLKIYEVREVIKLIDQSSIQKFELEHESFKISIKKESLPVKSTALLEASPISKEQFVHENIETSAPLALPQQEADPSEEKASHTQADLHSIISPMVGTFYCAPEPGVSPYVQVGDTVKEDSIVCIVEAMKLFNEIEAEVTGEIVEVLVKNGELVEYGQPLFLVKPE
nr:acetyl-CoA carboxylase biotin carboxyl carrier protein [Aneurinibacillus sp. UBA3580]